LGALERGAASAAIEAALESRRDDASALVREHVAWALARSARLERGLQCNEEQ
jgi:epoxyqueuosine reductase